VRKQRLEAGFVAALGVVLSTLSGGAQQQGGSRIGPVPDFSVGVTLVPTSHPRLSGDLSQLWFVPERSRTPVNDVIAALRMHANGQSAKALPVLSRPSSQQGPLGLYAMYDTAVAERGLGRLDEARRAFQTILDRQPIGYLNEAAALGEAECDEALKDPVAAVAIYDRLLLQKIGRTDEVLVRLGAAAKAAGQLARATEVYARVYYDFPLSEHAATAGSELAALPTVPTIGPANEPSERYKRDLARADRLFQAKQYPAARSAFTNLRAGARGDDRELVDLRIAESNYHLKRARDAREGLRPYIGESSRLAEALYFSAASLLDLGDTAGYLKTIRRVADDFPKEGWAEEALNHLATHYIRKDDDEKADETLRELYARNPRGPYAERAAWKVGWRAYAQHQYAEAAMYFERAASDFPRSDYRPVWLYWSGRAHESLKEPALAEARFALVTTDYLNSYYGRLAITHLAGSRIAPRLTAEPARGSAARGRGSRGSAGPSNADRGAAGRGNEGRVDNAVDNSVVPPPNAALIGTLTGAGLYDEALNELRFAQRTWGDSSPIQATIAWISRQQGLTKTGTERFNLVRGAITMMRRAYPQFMAAGGEQLPTEILSVIFPLEHWDLIQRYATTYGLDPYLVAALIAQESTFVPDIRSHAGAVGLTQLMTPTARQYARKLKIPYSPRVLTNPDTNIRMGTALFADLIKKYGAVHLALASYNAGETPVRRWLADRPGLPAEEFIDEIPYPETQAYVKRIIGTAEDYRRLYKN
jgi:soluble lytic murein transglycosylase